MSKVIGTSLSFCIKDICEGKVKLEDVAKIIASTCCASDADLADVIQSYQRIYWRKYPAMAEQVTMTLASSGRLIQPRLNGEEPPGPQYRLVGVGLSKDEWWTPVEHEQKISSTD